MKYYPIDEDAARRAKNANSLSDYAEGSATDEYRREVSRAATLAEECKKGKTEAQQEKIDYLLDRYARRLADNMNASNRNRASCPSVMVAGWSNFPVRKKQQQISRDDTLMREWRDIQGILDQIRAVGHGGISGMDADARERVQAKLAEREVMQEKMKSVSPHQPLRARLRGVLSRPIRDGHWITTALKSAACAPASRCWTHSRHRAILSRRFLAAFYASPQSGCSWFLTISPPLRCAILLSSGVSAGHRLRAHGSGRIPPTADTLQSRLSRLLRRMTEMVKYIKGDVLNCEATLVAHQVNAFGVMGGGIAAAIWPLLTQESQSAYVEKCRHDAKLPITEWMGSIQILDTKREGLEICNLFTQYPSPVDGTLTAYGYLWRALDLLRIYAVLNDYDIVAVPARIGCGIAGGDWDKVQHIIHDVYDDSGITMLIVDNQ